MAVGLDTTSVRSKNVADNGARARFRGLDAKENPPRCLGVL